ncbi:hypothetical protein J6590_018854 [Homalodisca vitripennis]|nr:hypothetical protein J6590_018854 [Homalodisca vitripennis]
MVLGTERYSEDPARVAVSSPEVDLSEQDVTAEHANAKGNKNKSRSNKLFRRHLLSGTTDNVQETYFRIRQFPSGVRGRLARGGREALTLSFSIGTIFAAVLIGELTLSHGFWYYSSSSANAEKKL